MKKLSNDTSLADLLTDATKQPSKVFTDKSIVNAHEYYLVGTIEDPSEYTEWFNQIRHCNQTDNIKIYINSCGGDLMTAIQFMEVMRECGGTIVAAVEGACMSAATILFLSADIQEISDNSMFMFHNYSGGTFGKGGEMMDQIKHERAWSEKLLRSVYTGFLTDAEISSILNNKDIWMSADEVRSRLAKREKLKTGTVTAAKKSSRKAKSSK